MFAGKTNTVVLICMICLSQTVSGKNYFDLGNEAFDQRDYIKAVEYYRLAIDSEPTFAAYVNLGHCYMQLKRWDDAASTYEAAIQIKQESATADIWRSLGRACFEGRRYKLAIDAFLKAYSLAPTDSQDNIWLARCMVELGQWIQAESVLLSQLRYDPGDITAIELLAFTFSKQGNWSGITGVYKELLKISPQKTSYRVALAKTLMFQGQKQQAIDTLEFARRVDVSASEEIDRLLADLYLAEQMPQEAARCYARLIAVLDKPSAEDYYRLGMAYFQKRDLTSAEDAFNKIQQVNRDNFRADLYLGHVFREAARLTEAEHHYKAAIEKNPKSVESLVALADLQMKIRHHADAADNLSKAISLGDNRPQVHYNYIVALMNGEDDARLRSALKVAIAEHPSDEQLSRLLDQYVMQKVPE